MIKKHLDRFLTHLKPIEQKGVVESWSDNKIASGQDWREEIRKAIAKAKIALLLVSPEFLASDFISNNELPPILRAARRNGLTVLWVLVSASNYQHSDIEKFQAAHDISKPLDALSVSKRNAVVVEICKKIEDAINP